MIRSRFSKISIEIMKKVQRLNDNGYSNKECLRYSLLSVRKTELTQGCKLIYRKLVKISKKNENRFKIYNYYKIIIN